VRRRSSVLLESLIPALGKKLTDQITT